MIAEEKPLDLSQSIFFEKPIPSEEAKQAEESSSLMKSEPS